MFGKKIIFLLLVFGLAISLFSTWSASRMAKSLYKDYIELKCNLFDCEYRSKRYKEKFAQNIFSKNQYISNISLLDAVPIANIINNSKLVYRFYKGTCI